jgi:hypothetical protein
VSVTGIAANLLFQTFAANTAKKSQGSFGQIHSEVQQLGQDLQAGNLTQAQQDFAALAKNFPGATAASQPPTPATNTNISATTSVANNSPSQAFSAVGRALQSGNLSAAQAAFATLQQDLSPSSNGRMHLHHQHHAGAGSEGDSQAGASNPIAQALSTLLQDVQSGNFSAAQSAYATMQQEMGLGSPATSNAQRHRLGRAEHYGLIVLSPTSRRGPGTPRFSTEQSFANGPKSSTRPILTDTSAIRTIYKSLLINHIQSFSRSLMTFRWAPEWLKSSGVTLLVS